MHKVAAGMIVDSYGGDGILLFKGFPFALRIKQKLLNKKMTEHRTIWSCHTSLASSNTPYSVPLFSSVNLAFFQALYSM